MCNQGGKDSLVVWQMAASAGKQVHLFYASDGDEELLKNWRLHTIGSIANNSSKNPYNIGQWCGDFEFSDALTLYLAVHHFDYNCLVRIGRSSLTPCGHPWAALVLFDSVLVR